MKLTNDISLHISSFSVWAWVNSLRLLIGWLKRQKAQIEARHAFRRMSPKMLRDIGLTKADVTKLTGMPNIHF